MTKKQRWEIGSLFLVPQMDGQGTLGQVIDKPLGYVVSCAFYDLRFPIDGSTPAIPAELPPKAVFSLISTTQDRLDAGSWRVVGRRGVPIPPTQWPNEEFRKSNWVGAKIHNANIVEEFLNAFRGCVPWDDWQDPHYLDRLLVSPEKRPGKLLYKRGTGQK